MMEFPIYEFRPLPNLKIEGLRRYADGEWLADDGEHDVVFIGRDSAPMCYYITLPFYVNIRWKWAQDGRWGAFVSSHPRGNAWHYMLAGEKKEWGESWNRDGHLNRKAGDSGMSKMASECGCANGCGPDFTIMDPYIRQGLLRSRDTKEVVMFPEIFDCMYCGRLDWKTMDCRWKP